MKTQWFVKFKKEGVLDVGSLGPFASKAAAVKQGRAALKLSGPDIEVSVTSKAAPKKRKTSRKRTNGASPLKFSFQWSAGGGTVKFRKGVVGKVGRIGIYVSPTNDFPAYLYEDAPNWVLMRDYIHVARSDGSGKTVPYQTKSKVYKAAQKALEKETGLPPTPRAQPRKRNAGRNVSYRRGDRVKLTTDAATEPGQRGLRALRHAEGTVTSSKGGQVTVRWESPFGGDDVTIFHLSASKLERIHSRKRNARQKKKATIMVGGKRRSLNLTPVGRREQKGGHVDRFLSGTSWTDEPSRAGSIQATERIKKFLKGATKKELAALITRMGGTAWESNKKDDLARTAHLLLHQEIIPTRRHEEWPERVGGITRRRNAKRNPNPVKVGDIFYSSWGYDQTNVDFYQVTKTTPKMVTVQKVNKRVVSGWGEPSESVMPNIGDFVKPQKWGMASDKGPLRRRVQMYSGEPSINITDHQSAWFWDGKPKHITGPHYGH